MNITGGLYRGRKIKTVNSLEVRPTSSKVRESIFNMLHNRIDQAVMLDLFAGSGIMGIEAASRGAKEIIYVEKSPKVAEMLKENLANFDFKNEIFVCDALKALDILKGRQFNIIFADPPYASGIIPDILEKVRNNGLLADEGVLIVEYASKLSITESAEKNGFNEIKYKTYGDTAVSFLSTKTE